VRFPRPAKPRRSTAGRPWCDRRTADGLASSTAIRCWICPQTRGRVSAPSLAAFIAGLRDRVAPASAGMMTGALHRMLTVLEPRQDWTALARVYNHLKQTAAPSRDKLACMVPASELLDLGIKLMDTCDRGQNETYKATRYRDGLIIALLISCLIRLKKLTGLMVGQHLVFDGHDYQMKLPAAETKTGRPMSRPCRTRRRQCLANLNAASSGPRTECRSVWTDYRGAHLRTGVR